MPTRPRVNTATRLLFALLLMLITLAACNLGAPENAPVDITAQPSSTGPAATRTLLDSAGIPTSAAITITPISFPTRIAFVTQPPVILPPPSGNPAPTNTPLPYSIVILSPLPGNVVAGNVQVIGSAIHPQFLQYRLEFGPDPNPANLWFPVTGIVQSPVLNGILGIWNTTSGGSSDGFYQVRLRVFLRDGSQQTTVVNSIKVQNTNPTPVPTNTPSVLPPIAAFTQDFTAGNAPLTVKFFNQSQGNITGYLWNFGNGFTSAEANPTMVFNTPGVYTVVLNVTGPGGTANVSRQINVTSASAPVAAFTPNKVSGEAPLTVSFANQSTGNITGYEWDFGDGTSTKDVNPTKTFTAVGTYNVILKVTGPGGSSTMIRQITVVNPQVAAPVANFAATPTTGTTPLTVAFLNTTQGQVTQYLWDFNGDGITDSVDKDPTHVYTTGGTFTVRLTAIGPGGQNTKTLDITAQAPPSAPAADFTANPLTGNAPLIVTFTNTTTGTATGYVWDFNNDGQPDSTETSPTFTYNTPGTYVAKLTASNAGGSTTKQAIITVNQPPQVNPPVAQFTANPTTITAGESVTFTNTSTGTIDSLAWDFDGDGTNDNTADNVVTFTYSTAGTFTAKLTVTNSGGSNSITLPITVNPAAPNAPIAAFTANPTSGDAPLTVTFTNTSSGQVDSLAWDFDGDGSADNTTDNVATFTYNSAGTFNATLTVTNAGGSDSISQAIVVSAPLPNAPIAAFTADPSTGTAPLTVTFTNTSSGQVDSLAWDFDGDGSADNTTDNVATFTYNSAGTFNATLTVTNAGGSNSFTASITVNEAIPAPPVANFTTDVSTGTAPLTVTFTNMSSGTVTSFAWDFDGDTIPDDTTSNPVTFTYNNPGTYNATLTVANAGGSDSISVPIVVNAAAQPPVASFTVDTNTGNAPLTVTFTSTSTGTVDSLSWDFNGDTIPDDTNNPTSFTFNDAGTYTVTLTVNGAGQSSSTSQTITVNAAPQVAQAGIVYAVDGEIYLMNTDGTNPQNLTNHGATDKMPAVSPDGTKVVFVSDRDGNEDIYVLNISDLSVTRLTGDGNSDIDPAWSPNGSQIVFASNRFGGGNPADYDIMVMSADGSNQVQLTAGTARDSQPGWSPDGSRVVFVSDMNDGNNEIYTMNASDGQNVTRLTTDSGDDTNPAWSPDGSKIVFSSNRLGIAGGNPGDYDIFTMNASDGGGLAQLTTESAPDIEPAWSEDGSQVVFVSSRNTGEFNVYIMNANGNGQTQLTFSGSSEVSPSWRVAP